MFPLSNVDRNPPHNSADLMQDTAQYSNIIPYDLVPCFGFLLLVTLLSWSILYYGAMNDTMVPCRIDPSIWQASILITIKYAP